MTESRAKELLANCIKYVKTDNDSAVEHLHEICGFTNDELTELGFDYLCTEEVDLSTFMFMGNNRKEAFEVHTEFEKGFEFDCRSVMDYETFCKELDKGYGKSDYIQVARLYEAPDGTIWYDFDYCV